MSDVTTAALAYDAAIREDALAFRALREAAIACAAEVGGQFQGVRGVGICWASGADSSTFFLHDDLSGDYIALSHRRCPDAVKAAAIHHSLAELFAWTEDAAAERNRAIDVMLAAKCMDDLDRIEKFRALALEPGELVPLSMMKDALSVLCGVVTRAEADAVDVLRRRPMNMSRIETAAALFEKVSADEEAACASLNAALTAANAELGNDGVFLSWAGENAVRWIPAEFMHAKKYGCWDVEGRDTFLIGGIAMDDARADDAPKRVADIAARHDLPKLADACAEASGRWWSATEALAAVPCTSALDKITKLRAIVIGAAIGISGLEALAAIDGALGNFDAEHALSTGASNHAAGVAEQRAT